MIRHFLAAFALLLAANSAQASLSYAITAAPDARIRSAASNKEKISQLLTQGDRMELGQLWHGLEWLLDRHCGATPCVVVMGGRKIGPDLGYGPAFYYTAAEVKHLARLLAAIDPAQLAASFDANAMDAAKIHPNNWAEMERSGEKPLEKLQDAFVRLRGFFQRSADAGHGVAYVLY